MITMSGMRIETAIKRVMQYYEIAKSNDWIRDKTAWALHQAWKEADAKPERRLTQNEICDHPDKR